MGSIIKMFKPSKKNSNKENVPSVTFATNSLTTKKTPLNESVYVGEPQKIDLRLKSPYAVITAPKVKKGPMSCPGAPMDDTSFADRQNLLRNSSRDRRIVKDDLALTRRSELIEEQAYRNMMARQQYDMSMSQAYDSDEEDEKYRAKYRAVKAENTTMRARMDKMKMKWKEEKTRMNETIDELSAENYKFRKERDRARQKYAEIKSNIEMEKMMKTNALRMLQEANARIEKLEKARDQAGLADESLNNSSLLMPSYTDSALERSSEGAGEALCFPDVTMNQMSSFSTSLFSRTEMNPLPQSLEDDLDAQDEVRVFRNSAVEDEDDEEMSEEEAEEMEVSSPFEVETLRDSERAEASDINASAMGVETVSLAPPELETGPPQLQHIRQKYSRTSSWLKRNSINPDDDGSSDSSEEERLSLIERQLKKKGGLVKYNPPRTKIHDKYYKRFGKNERSALAEFEYLQDMSTDVSGMQSSPELGQLMGQLMKK